MIGRMVKLLAVLALVVGMSALLQRAQAYVTIPFAYVSIDTPAGTYHTGSPDIDLKPVDFATSGHQVGFDGIANKTWQANWLMELWWTGGGYSGNHMVDSDDGGEMVTTDGDGHWEHNAHGTGSLSGTPILTPGSYTAHAKSSFSAVRQDGNPPHESTSAAKTPEPTSSFSVVKP